MFQRFFLDFGFVLGSLWASPKPILSEFLDFDSILGSFWAPATLRVSAFFSGFLASFWVRPGLLQNQ